MNGNIKSVPVTLLWKLFWRWLWVMLLAGAVAAGGLFGYSRVIARPSYESMATLYILRQDGDTGDASEDFSVALKVINDCTYILKSHAVVDAVIRQLGLDESYQGLCKRITIQNPDNTRILEVTVEAESAERAMEIVDALCQVGREKIADTMGFYQANWYEQGTLTEGTCNGIGLFAYVLVAGTAAAAAYGALLAVYLRKRVA